MELQGDSDDGWGKRRDLNGSDDTANSLTGLVPRGYIGQEEPDDVGLIQLNARVYDPLLGGSRLIRGAGTRTPLRGTTRWRLPIRAGAEVQHVRGGPWNGGGSFSAAFPPELDAKNS